jgi:hypothetical protein
MRSPPAIARTQKRYLDLAVEVRRCYEFNSNGDGRQNREVPFELAQALQSGAVVTASHTKGNGAKPHVHQTGPKPTETRATGPSLFQAALFMSDLRGKRIVFYAWPAGIDQAPSWHDLQRL